MPKTTDNATIAIRYNFDAPINQAKEEDDKDLELSEKMAREIKRTANSMQPYLEAIKTINLNTREDPKETKLRGNIRAEPQKKLIKLLRISKKTGQSQTQTVLQK